MFLNATLLNPTPVLPDTGEGVSHQLTKSSPSVGGGVTSVTEGVESNNCVLCKILPYSV